MSNYQVTMTLVKYPTSKTNSHSKPGCYQKDLRHGVVFLTLEIAQMILSYSLPNLIMGNVNSLIEQEAALVH